MAKKVFISYRREDTAPAAGRVYDRLSRLLSKRNVFFDVSTVSAGENFESRIVSGIEKSDAALVFIGTKWLEPGQGGGARICEPNDYVRAELRAALARGILVLPVLVEGARMPRPELLPEDVKAMATKSALPLRHESFDDDAENIVAAILGGSAKARSWDDRGRAGARIAYLVAGATAGLVLLALAALAHFWVWARPLSASIGDSATTLLLIGGTILGAWMGLRYEAWKRGPRTGTRSGR